MRRRWIPLAVALTTVALAQEQAPASLDATRYRFSYAPNQEVHPADFLALWGRALGALVFDSPELRATPVRMRFLTGLSAELTWKEAKQILATYGVSVIEQKPPQGSWIVQATLTQLAPQSAPAPYRYVGPGDPLPAHDEVVTAVFPIRHGGASGIFSTLRNLAARDRGFGSSGSFYVPGGELIVVTDLASRVRYYQRLIAALDVPGPRLDMRVFDLRHAPAADVAQALTGVLTAFAQSGLQPGAQPLQQPNVVSEARTNQLIVVAHPGDLGLIEELVGRLDRAVPDPLGNLYVYACQAADALYLAGKLEQLLSEQATAAPPPAGGEGPEGPSQVVIEDETQLRGLRTRIVADERRNALMIQAPPARLERILSLLAELDRHPARVLIEVQIWELSEPDSVSLGFELTGLTDAHEGSLRPILATGFGGSSLTPRLDAAGNPVGISRVPNELTGAGNFGFAAALTKDSFDRIPIVARALATRAESRLINQPFTLVDDNVAASFDFSDEIPIQVTSFVQGSGQATGVEFVNATSSLSVTPQVHGTESLTLQLDLRLSAFSAGGGGGLPPPKSSRSYSGVVTVPNGRYVVIGGLNQESESIEERKVPFLGDLPILGHLFKTWTRSRDTRRLCVFVRPTILDDPEFADEVAFGARARREVHAQAKRDAWLPPLIPDSKLEDPGRSLVDQALEVFGTGSADPLGD
ncbi:MAG: secretin N-terminal domain-containing protein [Planctomycetota bacterium]